MVCYTTRYFAASGFAKQEKERPRRIFCIKSYYKTREDYAALLYIVAFLVLKRKKKKDYLKMHFSYYFKCGGMKRKANFK